MKRLKDINEFHNYLFDNYSDFSHIAGWGNRDSQIQRFDALLRAAQFSGGSVVDYGCGPGDFLPFLAARTQPFSYIGLDQSQRMIRLACERHGEHFAVIELDQVDFEPVDYVFASGIFQFRGDDNGDYVRPLLMKIFLHCRKAMAINFLSSLRVDSEKVREELYYHPCEIVEIAKSITSYWCIDHTYHAGSGDLTVGLHKKTATSEWKRPMR